MTPFSFPETQEIIRQAPVSVSMQAIVVSRGVKVEKRPPWKLGDRLIPTEPFRLFRAVVTEGIKRGYATAIGKERERLLAALRMVEADTNIDEVAEAVGEACEDYAILMQIGTDGLRAYREAKP